MLRNFLPLALHTDVFQSPINMQAQPKTTIQRSTSAKSPSPCDRQCRGHTSECRKEADARPQSISDFENPLETQPIFSDLRLANGNFCAPACQPNGRRLIERALRLTRLFLNIEIFS